MRGVAVGAEATMPTEACVVEKDLNIFEWLFFFFSFSFIASKSLHLAPMQTTCNTATSSMH
jgi:hypothetical protein